MFCAALYLQDGSADRRETFIYYWKCEHLDIVRRSLKSRKIHYNPMFLAFNVIQ